MLFRQRGNTGEHMCCTSWHHRAAASCGKSRTRTYGVNATWRNEMSCGTNSSYMA